MAVSSHSIIASQSFASTTAKRFPFTVTYWTDCKASNAVMV